MGFALSALGLGLVRGVVVGVGSLLEGRLFGARVGLVCGWGSLVFGLRLGESGASRFGWFP